MATKVGLYFKSFIHLMNNLLFSRIIYAKMSVGNNIKQIRELKNYTQEYVAGELEVSQATYALSIIKILPVLILSYFEK